MPVRLDDRQERRERRNALRVLIERCRAYAAEGASPKTTAAYLQAIHAAEAEITEIDRHIAGLPHPEEAPPKAG